MPRDGSGTYNLPYPDVVPDTTIESQVYNGFTNDVAQDLNTARPILYGGTGAESAAEALANLGGEMASQLVSNFDSHVWFPGSFRAAITASGAPVAGHAFSGWVYSADATAFPPTNQNVTIEARDLTETTPPGEPGILYTRAKRAGVWGPWRAISEDLRAYIDGRIIVAPDPPAVADPPPPTMWWDSDSGQLYIRYKDEDDTVQWVTATQPGAQGLQGDPGPTGETGAVGPVGPMGASEGRTVHDVAGQASFVATVPLGSKGARFSGVLRPGSAVAGHTQLQVGFVDGVFLTAVGNYNQNGYNHQAVTNSINPYHGTTSVAGMQMTSGHTDGTIPMTFEGQMILKRTDTTAKFVCTARGFSYQAASGAIHSFVTCWPTPAATGTETAVFALRFQPSNSVPWGPDSYIVMEWF